MMKRPGEGSKSDDPKSSPKRDRKGQPVSPSFVDASAANPLSEGGESSATQAIRHVEVRGMWKCFDVDLLSPPCQLPMGDEFNFEIYVNNIFRNLIKQDVTLSVYIWRKLIAFCKRDFGSASLSDRVALQLLFLASKQDPAELTTIDSNHTILLRSILEMHPPSVRLISDSDSAMIKRFLTLDRIIRAISKCLEKVFDSDGPDDNWIRDTISSMRMYEGYCNNIRGTCLQDGIFLNRNNILGSETLLLKLADLMTLVCHETAHYLARRYKNNFDFSSPFSCLSSNESVCMDRVDTKKRLELGRHMELVLFDIQPDWPNSSMSAAEAFLRRAEELTDVLPLLTVAENSEPSGFRLAARKKWFPSMGIDFDFSDDIPLMF